MIIIMVLAISLFAPLALAITNQNAQSDMYDQTLILVDFEVNITFTNASMLLGTPEQNNNVSLNGNPELATSADCPVGNSCAVWDSDFDPDDDFLTYRYREQWGNIRNMSYSCWTNSSGTTNAGWIGNHEGTGANPNDGKWGIFNPSGTSLRARYSGNPSGFDVNVAPVSITQDHWKMYTVTLEWNGTSDMLNQTIYENGTMIASGVSNTVHQVPTPNMDIELGRIDNEHDSGLDHCVVFNFTLNQQSVEHLYNITNAGQALTTSSAPEAPAAPPAEDNNVSTAVKVFLNGTQANIVLITTDSFTASYEEVNGTAIFTRNGTVIGNNSVQSLAVGVFNFTAAILATDSNFATFQTFTALVNAAPVIPPIEDDASTLRGFAEQAGEPLINLTVLVMVIAVFVLGFVGIFRRSK